ncbi:MAG: SH3 domain-containing protein [Treponema sp.]|nr:SH3 domain-containing protein [Treponema sp.]
MKKLISILAIIFSLCTSLAFADKSRFYEDGKVIDTMYVDSPEGLRVRSAPSLKSNRICGLTHRLPVKIVAIGKEEEIDGIMAPWVEILIPRYEWKSDEPEYGWVFGGYLAVEKPTFVAPQNASELADYLSTYMSWAFADKHGESLGFMHFYRDGTFSEIHPAPGDAGFRDSDFSDGSKWYGTWKTLDSRTFFVSAEKRSTGEKRTRTVTLKEIGDIWWTEDYGVNSGVSLFSSKTVDGHAWHEIETIRNGSILKTKGVYLNDYWGGLSLSSCYFYESRYYPQEQLIMEYIKAGINASSLYYNTYWDPIMREHQKKADEME